MITFTIFYLIFLSYGLTRQRLNPIASFKYITQPAHRLLEQCEKDAKQLGEILRKDPSLKPDKAYLADYEPHVLMQRQYDQFNEFLGYLYDYHDKLVDKKDYSAALMVLNAIGNLIAHYIEVRKNTFIMLPSDYILVPTTDAQKFFDANFQRLRDRAAMYMKLGNQDGLRKVLGLFEGVGVRLRDLSFPSDIPYENPPFAQCVAYLGYVTNDAIQQKDLEATFQLARIYGILGAIAVDKRYMHATAPIYDDLLKLVAYGGSEKQQVVTDRVAQAFGMITREFAKRTRGAQGTDFSIYVDKLCDFYWYYIALTRTNPSVDYQANVMVYMLESPQAIVRWMAQLAAAGSNTRNPERDNSQRDVMELAKIFRRLLTNLGEKKYVSLGDRYFGTEIASVISSGTRILVMSAFKHGWQRHKDELLSEAAWLLRRIGRIADNAPDNIRDHQLDELSNKATNVALYGLYKGSTRLAIAGISINYDLAMVCLEKNTKSADYGAPRIMVNACLIAALALHKQDAEVLRYCKEMVIKFNNAYAQKYFPDGFNFNIGNAMYIGTYPQQLFTELRRLWSNPYDFPSSRFEDMVLGLPESYLKKLEPGINRAYMLGLIKYFKALR